MRITLLVVGKTLKGWIKDGLDIYTGRLAHYVRFEIKEMPELRNAASLSRDEIKQREGELILKSLKSDDKVILLDERGEMPSSMLLASKISEYLQQGRNIVYVVGGAYGFSPAVYDRAEGKLSLSRMTFSHQMIRVIFVEQLYRAFTIIGGEPYHHE